jgi:hypothetical protein
MPYSIMPDKDVEKVYNEVKDLLKIHNGAESITIDYRVLDGETESELRQAIQKVLHKRYNELSSMLNGVGEFVIHNR